MSHITTISVKITDLAALREAAADCGLQLLEEHTYEAYYGDGNECDYVISTEANRAMKTRHRQYEVGVCKTAEGHYELKYDTWQGGRGLIEKIGGSKAEKLVQQYAYHATCNAAAKAGMTVTTERLANGDIKLRLARKQQAAKAFSRW